MKTLKEFASQNSIGGPGSAPDGEKICELLQSSQNQIPTFPGRRLGWNLLTPSAF